MPHPRPRRSTFSRWGGGAVLTTALTASLVLPVSPVTPAASAEPSEPERGLAVATGRGAATAARAPEPTAAGVARRAAAAPAAGDPIAMPESYPYQPQLRLYRDNPDDAADTPQLLTHPDLAPRLTQWMAQSDRISTQVIGQSTEGRDLYLVTVTAPERAEDTAAQTAWREEIRTDPVAAAADRTLQAQYKTPIWVSANIHGNEWEGTDAVMQYIDRLVTAPESQVGSILRNNRLYFSLSLNPDGRTNATRATALGLDPNRDMITNTTPEATSFVRTAQAIQPIYSADLHGYTNVLQMEPTGPPHGSNYEYDLYLPHNYALALDVEKDVVAANIPGNTYYNVATGGVVAANTSADTAHIKIPYRDTPSGWDDFPPIFTAQYAAFYGAATATVELPLARNVANRTRQSPENGRVNTAVGLQTITSLVDYLDVPTTARDMLRNQIEVFRRGVAGEAKQALTGDKVAAVPGPDQWKPLWDAADDQEVVDLPRAYVIPMGAGQRSASDASRLVEQLLFHDIEVGRLTEAATVGGTTYAAGSYVVDLHQPLRGLANSLLDLGEDISAKVPTMYDISAWSYASLWGATVDSVGDTTDALPVGPTVPVSVPTSVATLPQNGPFAFDLAGVADVQAVNALLERGVDVTVVPDGTAVVPTASRVDVADVFASYDVAVTRADAADRAGLSDPDARALEDLTVAYAGTQDERLAFAELGFDDVVPVTAAGIQAAATAGTPTGLEDADVLWVGSALTLAAGSPGRAAVQAFVDRGGDVLGRGTSGFAAASTYGLVSGTAVAGNSSGNGIVAVETAEDSFLEPYALDEAFIYPATWFTGVGETTVVEQRYAADPLLAGHWLPGVDPRTGAVLPGPADAAGQASVISGEAASGARSVVFGTSVFFRTHPKAQMSQVGRSLFWATGAAGRPGAPTEPGDAATTLSLSTDSPRRYPEAVSFRVAASDPDGAPTGTVVVRAADGRQVGSGALAGGAATIRVSGLVPGTTGYTATYTPDASLFTAATSPAVRVRVDRAVSATTLRVVRLQGRQVRLVVGLDTSGAPRTGSVVITDRGKRRTVITFDGAATERRVIRLSPGRHVLRASYAGTTLVEPSRSPRVTVRGR